MRFFLCLLLVTATAYAQGGNRPLVANGLGANQLDAIRSIGQNLLMAKKTAKKEPTDPADNEPLSQLRATVDKLIDAEMPTDKITVQQTPVTPSDQQAASEARRNTARTAGWDVVSKLHQEAGQLHKPPKAAAKQQIYSGGFPVGEQRGRLYERWAQKLEAILAKDSTGRVLKLMAFRDQLQANHRGVVALPLEHKTPTLQAMPWNGPKSKTE